MTRIASKLSINVDRWELVERTEILMPNSVSYIWTGSGTINIPEHANVTELTFYLQGGGAGGRTVGSCLFGCNGGAGGGGGEMTILKITSGILSAYTYVAGAGGASGGSGAGTQIFRGMTVLATAEGATSTIGAGTNSPNTNPIRQQGGNGGVGGGFNAGAWGGVGASVHGGIGGTNANGGVGSGSGGGGGSGSALVLPGSIHGIPIGGVTINSNGGNANSGHGSNGGGGAGARSQTSGS
ncbi:MAG: hypothetical protein FWD81_02770, partial [Methanomassiliicoccaceae archaeon]|nr:hypothetical protein [Methanomassiliicoccaceae archaeon]